ncbi:transglycosylase family protein [Streptomyces sp. NPDC051940]|uniref:transglycosylase family protein n=1 Tax=Streptomyces sp. NPDC051940 TaxID=3155675 RepID=UPI00343FD803
MFTSALRKSRTARIAGTAAVLGAAGFVMLGTAGSASAAPAVPSSWNSLAQCEASGNWNANTGNGFYGGLQFTQQTWNAFGGQKHAPRADMATPAEQVNIAKKVLAEQGIGAWPVCGPKSLA